MDDDGDGSSSSGDVSSTAADEEPRADPELTQTNVSPPMMDLSPENVIAQMRLYDRTMPHRVQLDPNVEAAELFVVLVLGPRDDGDRGDHPRHADADADAGAYDDDYGSFVLGAVPASSVAIACLPETTVGEGEARESGECCPVCLDAYETGDALRTMPCAHGFHERCIFKWLCASRLCPLCRFKLPPEEDTETDDDDDDQR